MLVNAGLKLNDEDLDNVVGGISEGAPQLANVNDLVIKYGDNVTVGGNAIYGTQGNNMTKKTEKNKRLNGAYAGGSFDVPNVGRG